MRVEFSRSGQLEIISETDLEHYALRKWWEDWQTHTAVLKVSYRPDDSISTRYEEREVRATDG